MKKELNEVPKEQVNNSGEKIMTRKEALKKAGLVAASAATMMVMFSNNAEAHGSHGGHGSHRRPQGGPPRGGNYDPRTSPGC
ncbi:MAG: hypothetical protein R2757_20860 [Draconibacterium sp.]